jgi:hypothetical protein
MISRRTTKRGLAIVWTLLAFSLSLGIVVAAHQGTGDKPVKMKATLVDAEMNAKGKSAVVQVTVDGVTLIDPAMTNKQVQNNQGHLHYQVDNGPVIATPASKLSFHGLSSGKHRIVVMLAHNDHSPAGPQETLEITIP